MTLKKKKRGGGEKGLGLTPKTQDGEQKKKNLGGVREDKDDVSRT